MLQSKLVVPRIQKIFSRPRLFSILERITNKKLTLVVAGAGYGKTTLIAQKISKSPFKSVWYRLDETDMDLLVFVQYLCKGFEKYFKDDPFIFGNIKPGTSLSKKQRGQILENLIGKVETSIKDDVVLILDDFHLIQDNPEICKSIEFMLNHLPMAMHIIIISRVEPDIQISRLRVMREVIEIREQDIQFRIPEIEGLYSHVFNVSLTHKNLNTLYKKTKGWVASLILLQAIVKDKTNEEIEIALGHLKGSLHVIFQYLEENIYTALSRETKEFLIKTSLLDELDPKFCDQFLNISSSQELCEQLENSHLLTFQQTGRKAFYYHHLFKDFLQNKLLTILGVESQKQLCLDIACHLKESGDDLASIPFYLKGGQYTLAAAQIFALEEKMFNSGQINRIKHFLNQLPEPLIESMPGLQYVKAKLYSFTGEPHLAMACFNTALIAFKAEGSKENITKCQLQLGLNAYYTGDIQGAELHFETIIAKGIENKYLETLGLLILISSILGKLNKADAYADLAKKTIQKFHGPDRSQLRTWISFTYSYRFYVSGNFQQAYAMSMDMLEKYKLSDSQILLPFACLHIALPAYFLKKFNSGYECAVSGVEHLKEMGVQDNQTGWLNYAVALNLSGLDRGAEALGYIEKSLSIFKNQSNLWGQANACDLHHFIHLKAGRIDQAEHCLLKGLDILKRTDLPFTQGILEIGLSRIKLLNQAYDLVPGLLTSAGKKVTSSNFYMFKHSLVTSQHQVLIGKKDKACEHLERGLCLAEEYGYEQHIACEEDWINPPLLDLYSGKIKQAVIQRVFNLRGKKGQNTLLGYEKNQPSALSKAATIIRKQMPCPSSPGLNISLLGRFRLVLGDNKLSEKAFKKNLSAMMIIKYLAVQQNKGFIHRDELIELIWPDQDVKKTSKRFNVAVSFIRKLFEPSIQRGCPSSYLIKQKTGFKLDPGNNGSVDVSVFLDEINIAVKSENSDIKAAITHYLSAEAVYRGPFLIEDTYTQWCHEQREILQNKYLWVLTKLIHYFHGEKDFFKGLMYCEKYLGVDKTAEHIYREMMRFYSMAGNISQLKRTYHACEINVAEHLDCPLDQQTMDLYCLLLRNNYIPTSLAE